MRPANARERSGPAGIHRLSPCSRLPIYWRMQELVRSRPELFRAETLYFFEAASLFGRYEIMRGSSHSSASLGGTCSPEKRAYSAGNTKSVNMVALLRPPITTVASGF